MTDTILQNNSVQECLKRSMKDSFVGQGNFNKAPYLHYTTIQYIPHVPYTIFSQRSSKTKTRALQRFVARVSVFLTAGDLVSSSQTIAERA